MLVDFHSQKGRKTFRFCIHPSIVVHIYYSCPSIEFFGPYSSNPSRFPTICFYPVDAKWLCKIFMVYHIHPSHSDSIQYYSSIQVYSAK
jgi:hypothetical protein